METKQEISQSFGGGGGGGGGTQVHRRDQPRGEYKGWYQHKCHSRPKCRDPRSARGSRRHECDPDPSTFPSRLVLLLSYLSVSKWGFKLIYLQCFLCKAGQRHIARHIAILFVLVL